MIAVLGVLVVAAGCVALAVWRRYLHDEYLRDLAAEATASSLAIDEWERPRIVRLEGGVYDVEGDEWV